MSTRLADACLGAAVAAVVVTYLLRRRASKPRGGVYYAGMIHARPALVEQYMMLHDHAWPEVMQRMYESNMRDFQVWLHEETGTMFHSFVYIGDDFQTDMARIASDPVTRYWWTFCEPCQQPLHWKGPPPSQGGTGDAEHPGQWWSPLKLVNHCGGWATAWASELGPNPTFVPCHPQNLTTTKDTPPPVHNRTGPAASWTSYTQAPFVAGGRTGSTG